MQGDSSNKGNTSFPRVSLIAKSTPKNFLRDKGEVGFKQLMSIFIDASSVKGRDILFLNVSTIKLPH